MRCVLPPRSYGTFRSLRLRLQSTRVFCLRLPAPPEGHAARNSLTRHRFPPAFTGGPTTEQPHTAWRLTPPFSPLRLARRRPVRGICYQLPLWPRPFPVSASLPSPATKITVTCSARTEPVTSHSACAERAVRPDAPQFVSARYHAVVSAPHCCLLIPQTDSLEQGPCTLSSVQARSLRLDPAVAALSALQLGCSAASSGSRLRSPDCGFGYNNRKSLTAFAANSLRPFFDLELSAGLASVVTFRLLPIRPAADPRPRFSDLRLSASIFETQTRAIQRSEEPHV